MPGLWRRIESGGLTLYEPRTSGVCRSTDPRYTPRVRGFALCV
jgi:hypothetical protein